MTAAKVAASIISVAQSLKLLNKDRLKGRTNGGLRSMRFSEASHPMNTFIEHLKQTKGHL